MMHFGIRTVLFVLLTASLPLAAQNSSSSREVTGYSIAELKIGMTISEARKAMRYATFRRVSDGEGIPLIGVYLKSRQLMNFYAGEESSEGPIDENAVIEFIETRSSGYRTSEGIRVGMKVSDVESRLGKLKEIFMSEIESREFAEFSERTPGLQFRLQAPNDNAGIYPEGEMVAQSYRPGATVFSISVMGIDVMDVETIGGIGNNFTEPEVYTAVGGGAFGELVKGKDEMWGAIGEFVQTWAFPSKGISVDMASPKLSGKKRAYSITLERNSKLKTGRGIGIGSSKAEVIATYKDLSTNDEDNQGFFDGQDVYILGSVYGGIVFSFENGKVSKIFLGASAE